jgi:transposase
LFIALCQDVARRYEDRGKVHLVVDNYSIHHSKKTQVAVDALGGKVVLHFLPPYSPQGNPIERVWLNLHDNVTRNHRAPDIGALVNDALHYLDHYDGHGARAVAGLRRAA